MNLRSTRLKMLRLRSRTGQCTSESSTLVYILKISIIVASMHLAPIKTQAQEPYQADKQETLRQLRMFRSGLAKKHTGIPAFDSLVNLTTKLINLTQTINSISKLRRIQQYFTYLNADIDAASDSERLKIARLSSKDIILKLSDSSRNYLNFENPTPIFNDYNIHVRAYIDGSLQKTGFYRLHWNNFRGRSIDWIINSNKPEGSSKLFSNPYQITVTLPGYITFWLTSAKDDTPYKPDRPNLLMTENDTVVDVYFSKFKHVHP